MLEPVNPASVFKSPMYSQGLLVKASQDMLFVAGQVGVAIDGSLAEGVADQTRQAIANLNAVLAEAGMSADNIAKLTIYLTDAAHMPQFSEAAQSLLPAVPPAITLVIVKALAAPTMLVEIEAVAVR